VEDNIFGFIFSSETSVLELQRGSYEYQALNWSHDRIRIFKCPQILHEMKSRNVSGTTEIFKKIKSLENIIFKYM
jgi:hypothetical protein